jgi:hypothetical protein
MKTKHVTFALPKSISSVASSLNLPVRVHDENSHLVAQGTLSRGVDLAPGRYFISATLPGGGQISTTADLKAKTRKIKFGAPFITARHRPSAAGVEAEKTELEAAESGRLAAPLGLEIAAERDVEPRTASGVAQLVGYRGNLLAGKLAYFGLRSSPPATKGSPTHELLYPDQAVEQTWSVNPSNGVPTYIQLYEPGAPVRNYAVPAGQADGCTVRLLRTGKKLTLDITLSNRDADLLIRYGSKNMYGEALQVAESPDVLAQNLLAGKFISPIGAAVGAYLLLRTGNVDRLHDWTTNLYNYFKWMPDGAVILAEHLARVGNHEQALATLMELPKRGLPFMSSGLTYALNRLRQYAAVSEKQFSVRDGPALKRLISDLAPYANFTDIARPILTFTGSDPLRPSRAPAILSEKIPFVQVPVNSGEN